MTTDHDTSEPLTFSVSLGLRLIFLVIRALALIVIALVAFRLLVFLWSHFSTVVEIEKYGLKVLAQMVTSWKP